MICPTCGKDSEEIKDQWCMYQQLATGEVINKLFHPDRIPKGWYDSPKSARAANERKTKKATPEGLTI